MTLDRAKSSRPMGCALWCLMAACGARPGGQAATTPEETRAATEEEAWQPPDTRMRPEIRPRSFALICPQGASLAGTVPPGGTKAWCVRADGQQFGPSAQWDESGVLQRLTMFSEDGSMDWRLECDLNSEGTVVASLRSKGVEFAKSLTAERCEDLSSDIPGF